MDDYRAVRDLLPAPPLSPEVERAGRERLAVAFSQERVRRGRRAARWSALALGVAGAAAAAIVITHITPASVPAPYGAAVQADGKRFLLVAAGSVAAMPDEGAWWGSTEVHGQQFHEPGGRYVLRESESVETWIPADPEGRTWYRHTPQGIKPATPQDETAWVADGSPTSWTYDKPSETGRSGVVRSEPGEQRTWSTEDWDFRILTAGKPLTKMSEVPDTPEGLKALIAADDRTTIDTAARLLFFAPVTSETRAAAYRLLASVPGVTAVGQMTDALGRAGQAIEYESGEFAPPNYRGATRTRLVIDPTSGKPLSIETRSTANGLLLTYTAIQDSRWADSNPLKEKK
ncbi:CU044_5270 family protein [Nonomuraea sp. 3-1Str]|uniref:CU044_5270 family protein n=1 Tax=Nonomuraea sp. 3-1Str TaxID=2929801 RepID=UPI002863F639|nr:CU044_5270 family protein [Nonomuraea sp. 3-1Str]MDR8411881.1 CU044_5270 family protein [Nonomuraea sp. 3-1Str]